MSPSTLPYKRLSAYYFFYFAFVGTYSSYFGLYLASLGFAAPEIAILLSLMQVMRLFVPYLWGSLADHWGRRTPVIRLASVAGLLCFVPLFVLQQFIGLFAALALLAFFWCAALPSMESLTLSHLAESPEGYGRIRLWGSIGFIVAAAGVGLLLDVLPLSSLLWLCVLILIGTLAAALALPECAVTHATHEKGALSRLLLRPQVLALFTGCFFMSVAHGPLYVFYSIYLADHAYSNTAIGALWSLGVIAEIGVFLIMPRLLRHYSIKALLIASFGAAVLRFGLIGWGVDHLVVLLFAQLLHALTFGACHASSMAALQRWFPLQQQGRVQGLYGSISFGAGGLLGALASGYLWAVIGPAWVYSLASVAALCGLLFISFGLCKRV